jgi:hypothetical protein
MQAMGHEEEPLRGMARLSKEGQSAEEKRRRERQRVLDRKLRDQLDPSWWTRFKRRLRGTAAPEPD